MQHVCMPTWRSMYSNRRRSRSDRLYLVKNSLGASRAAAYAAAEATTSANACWKCTSDMAWLVAPIPDFARLAKLVAYTLFAEATVVRRFQLIRNAAKIGRRADHELEQLPDLCWALARVCVSVHPAKLFAACDMDLRHSGQIELGHKCVGVDAVIARVGVEIVEVEHERTSRSGGKRVEERRFAHVLLGNVHVVDVVFKQKRRADLALHIPDTFANHVQHIRIARRWQLQACVPLAVELVSDPGEAQVVTMPCEIIFAVPPRDFVHVFGIEY